MSQLHPQHWHVVVTHAGYQDGYEDQAFEDLERALDYANQTRDTFRDDGYWVTEVDRPEDDETGVIQRYQSADGEDAAVTTIEVWPCHQAACPLEPSPKTLHQMLFTLAADDRPKLLAGAAWPPENSPPDSRDASG